jgi:preprotein translocase subunit SecE
MARQGTDSPRSTGSGNGGRAAAPRSAASRQSGAPARERVGPRQYLSEVRSEMKKVAWPTRAEVIQSSLVVLIAVTFMTTLIFGFDWLSSHFVIFLFG